MRLISFYLMVSVTIWNHWCIHVNMVLSINHIPQQWDITFLIASWKPLNQGKTWTLTGIQFNVIKYAHNTYDGRTRKDTVGRYIV